MKAWYEWLIDTKAALNAAFGTPVDRIRDQDLEEFYRNGLEPDDVVQAIRDELRAVAAISDLEQFSGERT
jgi:hypothetical protein